MMMGGCWPMKKRMRLSRQLKFWKQIMPSHIYKFNPVIRDEDELVSLCMLIPGENLRRAVARCLWFDIVDELEEGVKLERLKALADPERIDREIDWSENDEQMALLLVGYTEEQIATRMRIHKKQRKREQSGLSPCEYERIIENNGARMRVNQWVGV
jgi:hypothetical protein